MAEAEVAQPSGNKEDEGQNLVGKVTPDPSLKSPQVSTHDAPSPKSKSPSVSIKEVKVHEEELKLEKTEEVEAEPKAEPDRGGKKKKGDKTIKGAGDGGDSGPKEKKKKGKSKTSGSEQSLGRGKKGKQVEKVASAVEHKDEEVAADDEKEATASASKEKASSASVGKVDASKSTSKTAQKKKKEKIESTVSLEGRKSKKDMKKTKTLSEVSMEDVEATPSTSKEKASTASVGKVDASKSTSKTAQKKKKEKTESTVSLEGKKPKKNKKKKTKTLSEVSMEDKEKKTKDNRKKKGKAVSEVSFAGVEDRKKAKKGKGKKVKTPRSPHSSTILSKKKESRSKSSLLKVQSKSKPSLEQLISRLSLHAVEMEKLRSKSLVDFEKKSSVWTVGSWDSYESDELEEETARRASSKMAKKKKKQKQKEKKGKRKKESQPSDTEASEEPEAKRKKGKGKKHKSVEEEAEVAVEPQVDMLAEIAKMKYLAEMQASGEEETETTTEAPSKKKKKKKKKKGPKKKLSKKEKARLAAEAAEKARISAEEEAARAAELERIRLEEERKAAIEKERREGFEQQIRMEQLETVAEQFRELVAFNERLRADAKAQAEWEFYVNCGRLPNPSKCDQMNTFLHLWENVVQETSMQEAARRTVDVLQLLNELDDLIDTAETKGSKAVENWKWVRLLFRKQQAKSLDVATYRLLRNIESNLNRIDIPTADYKYQDENIALCMWLRIQLPTPLPNPRRPPKPRIEVNFPEMKLEVQFPPHIDGEKMAVRALYVKYDHLSDLSDSYEKPPIPEQYDIDLYDSMKTEWRAKLLYKYENRVRKTPPPSPAPEEGQEGEAAQSPAPESTVDLEDEIPVVPYRKLEPTASEYVIAHEDQLYSGTRTELVKTVPDDVINLRRYSIVGGVYSLNLLHQPPQPQDFVTLEMNLTPLYLPKELELVDLYLDYNPPIPPDSSIRRPPEEIEEEMKKLEEELEKLTLVTLTWPEHVIFLELPMVCYWEEERGVWSKDEVHDLKHNEEKGQLSFRTRKGAIFALAVYRYANLPYQAWELRPEVNGSISLQITAAILMVEFNVKDGLIALSQLQNSPNNALQDIVGTYFPLPKLIRILQSAGVDVFPAFDAFCYIESSCEKHWPMEKNLYFNMAQLGVCFNFAWSRWNMGAGRRSVVLQMREYNLEKTKQKNHLMLHVTPLSALYVDCTEVSQTFNEEGIENMKFYPDLYHLMKGSSSMVVKNKIAKASKQLIFALYELLIATRVVSFS